MQASMLGVIEAILALLGTRGPDSQAAGGQMGAAATFSKQGQRLMGRSEPASVLTRAIDPQHEHVTGGLVAASVGVDAIQRR